MTNFWRNKKIFAYIALTHHTRFISPVMEEFAKKGAKTKYIVGQAERSQEITAIKLGLNYSHVFDYVTDEDDEDIHANYLRLREAFSNNLKNNFLFGTSPVTVIDKTIYSTAVEYIGFRNFLEKEKPDLCFALHELNRWGKMFSFWSKKLNIPVITFQEGLYYGLDFGYTGHVQNSTLNLVWGDRIKKKLVDFEAPEDRIIPVGNTHLSSEIEFQKKNKIRTQKRQQYKCSTSTAILLLFSVTLPSIKELSPIFESVSCNQDKRLFIKFHPITNHSQMEAWVSSIPDGYKKNIKAFHDNESTYNLMSLSDICVLIQPSTTGIEAMAFGKPLIHLVTSINNKSSHLFTEINVSAKMTPTELGKAISENIDFNKLINKTNIAKCLKNELSETKDTIGLVSTISQKIIEASQKKHHTPVQSSIKPDKEWSIILPLLNNAKNILKQLEAIALNSEDAGEFEVILIEPEQISKTVTDILDTLTGNVTRLTAQKGSSIPERMNKASQIATGRTLLFLDKNLLPLPKWLYHLKKGIKQYGKTKILGARIINNRGSLLHAGIVIDNNHAPVPAYKYLPHDFPNAMKERPFKMFDHLICINKAFFHEIGGFWEKTGKFAFMDICLRAGTYKNGKNSCMYIPDSCMISLDENKEIFNCDDSIYFFGKWHGVLWENQEELYSTDKITKEKLNAARMAQAMVTGNLIE